jgi:hypothetical protein
MHIMVSHVATDILVRVFLSKHSFGRIFTFKYFLAFLRNFLLAFQVLLRILSLILAKNLLHLRLRQTRVAHLENLIWISLITVFANVYWVMLVLISLLLNVLLNKVRPVRLAMHYNRLLYIHLLHSDLFK